MGIQKKTIKPRKCDKCNLVIEVDAAGIKAHARECLG